MNYSLPNLGRSYFNTLFKQKLMENNNDLVKAAEATRLEVVKGLKNLENLKNRASRGEININMENYGSVDEAIQMYKANKDILEKFKQESINQKYANMPPAWS